MQAILTKVIPATNTQPMRIKATCARGTKTFPISDNIDMEHNHKVAALCLKQHFCNQDAKEYGDSMNPWSRKTVAGCLPSGDYAHVFIQ